MRYGSVCSGIEAATVAWHPLGWKPAFFSEIEKFPCALLKHYYPQVPLHGDFTTIGAKDYGTIDLLVGGTPCQDFSVAGLGKGLSGDRGALTIEFTRLLERKKPRWFIWENVPGVLSNDDGRAFGLFLGKLAKCGYGFAYRVLDAQYFGVPQRRRRVFVIGYFGDWRPAAAVLFERESLQWNNPPRRKAGQKIANSLTERPDRGGGNSEGQRLIPDIAWALQERDAKGADSSTKEGHLIPCVYPINTQVAMRHNKPGEGTGMGIGEGGDPAYTLGENHSHAVAIPIHDKATRYSGGGENRNDDGCGNGLGVGKDGDPFPTLDTAAKHNVFYNMGIRRLTPVECERLMGFPDNYTRINEKTADGARYRALGNSMAVPVMRWLADRIQKIAEISG